MLQQRAALKQPKLSWFYHFEHARQLCVPLWWASQAWRQHFRALIYVLWPFKTIINISNTLTSKTSTNQWNLLNITINNYCIWFRLRLRVTVRRVPVIWIFVLMCNWLGLAEKFCVNNFTVFGSFSVKHCFLFFSLWKRHVMVRCQRSKIVLHFHICFFSAIQGCIFFFNSCCKSETLWEKLWNCINHHIFISFLPRKNWKKSTKIFPGQNRPVGDVPIHTVWLSSHILLF